MNNRNGLIAVGVVAVLAVVFALIQSSSLSQTQTQLSAAQTTATAQQAVVTDQWVKSVSTLSAANTQAADTQQKALVDAGNQAATAQATAVTGGANAAATAQASALSHAANVAATAEAKALADAAKAASTTQAQALAAASQAAATAQASALKDAANTAATSQAKSVTDAKNAAATQQAQSIATLQAGATATLGAVIHTDATTQAGAVADAQNAATTTQAQAIASLQAAATSTLGAKLNEATTEAQTVQATQSVLETRIAEANDALATSQAVSAQPTRVFPTVVATLQMTSVAPTAESTEQTSNVPADWKRYVGKGVAITLPKTYIGSELGSDPQALGKMLRSLGPDFESAATLLESNPEILSFIAVNVGNGSTNLASSVIILSIPLPASVPLNSLLDATISQLPSGSKVLEKGVVKLGQYDAGRMIVETHVGTIVSTQLQYYIITNNTLYLVGFTGAPNGFDSQVSSFEQSIKTFEILAKPGV